MKRKKPYDKSVYRSLVLVSQFGINMIVPIAMMCALGIFIDNKCDTVWVTPVLFFVGALAGGQNVYQMAKRIYDKDKRNEKTVGRSEGKEQNPS